MADLEPTYYQIKGISGQGMDQGDLHRSIYNLYSAVYAICNNLDEDAVGGTDYLSKIGTDLATAMTALKTPTGLAV